MSETAILAEGLKKSFGDVHALKGIDLSIREGSIFGLLGPNGAGKTTAVRILTTLLAPDAGRARVAGFDVVADAERLRSEIGLAGQSAAVDGNLTGLENLEMVGRLYHLPRAEAKRRAADVLERLGLTDAGDRIARTYSGGMRRRLDLGASLVGRPRVLFLDEPTTGLDPRSRASLWEMIRELQRDGTSDPAACAADQCHLALEHAHPCPLSRREAEDGLGLVDRVDDTLGHHMLDVGMHTRGHVAAIHACAAAAVGAHQRSGEGQTQNAAATAWRAGQ